MKEYLEKAEPIIADNVKIQVTIHVADAWILIGLLQLTCRHPDLEPRLKSAARLLVDQFSIPIIQKWPEVKELLDLGWNPHHDVPNALGNRRTKRAKS